MKTSKGLFVLASFAALALYPAVAGNYGVRITSLVSPADRLRAMEL